MLWVYKKRNTDLIFSFLINNLSGLHEGCLQQVRVFRENTSGSRNKCFIVILRSLLPRRKRTLLLGDNWISCHETRLVLNSIQQPQHAVWKCVAITALELEQYSCFYLIHLMHLLSPNLNAVLGVEAHQLWLRHLLSHFQRCKLQTWHIEFSEFQSNFGE